MTEISSYGRFFEANMANWSERAVMHRKDTSGLYGIEKFLNGLDVLCDIEAAEIGDVSGKAVLHLQCHFGLDTLCLARRGAAASGLDFSQAAVDEARNLSQASGVSARFVLGNLYEAPTLIPGAFDIVYVTWGAINWLPDIRAWARVVAHFLKPGGRLYLAEGHPAAQCFEQVGADIIPTYAWRTPDSDPLAFDEATSYAGTGIIKATRTYEWIHPISDILNALIASGLTVTRFDEHDLLPWKMFASMQKASETLFKLPMAAPPFPLSFSLDARKPA